MVDGIVKHSVVGLHSLVQTNQVWHNSSDGQSIVYNTPEETGKTLDAKQGKVPNFQSTCGIVSCVNVLRLAGRMATTEEELVCYAVGNGPLCRSGNSSGRNGGTSPKDRQNILAAFGVPSKLYQPSIELIAQYVENGHGVIISVDAGKLWKQSWCYRMLHAVTVTSVQRSKKDMIEGFFLCDSGRHGMDYARFYPAQHLKQALSPREMNVTTSIIR